MLPGIGIFGTGIVVKIIVPYLRAKGFSVEAIWGTTLSKCEKVAKQLEIPYYTNKIDNVLLRKDVDLIFIMCSPNLQAQIAVKALGIGKHVVCDKPAGLCQNEAIKMVHAAQYYPSLISVISHSLRYLPAFARMKQAIREGYLGGESGDDFTHHINVCDVHVEMELLHPNEGSYNWLCDKTMGGGVLTLIGSHVIDLISFLIDQRAIRVHGIVKTYNSSIECVNRIRQVTSPDFCSFQMEMSGNTLVTVTLNSHVSGAYNHQVQICGTNGHLVVRGGDLYGFRNRLAYNDNSSEYILYSEADDPIKLDVELGQSLGRVVPVPYVRGFFKMIDSLEKAFLSVEDKSGWVKESVADASTFEDGLYVQAVIDALYKSSAKREWVRINMITEEPDPNPLLSAAVRRTGISL